MDKNLQATLKSYWSNEDKFKELEFKTGSKFEEIVDDPNSFPEDVVSSLKKLLKKKLFLLEKLFNEEKRSLIKSPVVDLAAFRKLVLPKEKMCENYTRRS